MSAPKPEWLQTADEVEANVANARRSLPFLADPELRKLVELYCDLQGNLDEVVEASGLSPSMLFARLSAAEREAARRGIHEPSDMTHQVPEGFHVKGVSTFYTTDPETGITKVRNQWVKSRLDPEDRLTQLREAMHVLAEPLRGSLDPIPVPAAPFAEDLLCLYPMGDPHIGMYSWAMETGNNFDLDICTRNIRSAMDLTVAQSPPAKRALFVPLGDNFHADNAQNKTARSGHPLDVDGRWPKVLREGLRTFRWCIDRLLQKHEQVDVVVVIGNHDDHSAVFLSIALEVAYENEPRVTIHQTNGKFHYLRFGQNLFGFTHGDTAKAKDLPGIMSVDRAKDWGETLYRHWYTGHVHHQSVKDGMGAVVETFRVLAPGDAWHHAAGYRSDRDMRCDVWHANHGPLTRNIVGIRRILEHSA